MTKREKYSISVIANHRATHRDVPYKCLPEF
uniref:Uncharacterized protein n=1 Tax=Nelumbo nucifera TaxID=4432 RepID=A0A822XM91_NELNU|nr:TPA_asm: hypothetical protein HUJ06_024177 [Nelumbo nucifera]